MHSPHLVLARKLWAEHLPRPDIVIDATCGNGKDTLFLCQLGHIVHGFDIQEEAIERTKELLKENNCLDRAHLYLASHVSFPPLSPLPKLIIYNLGYLPRGNKEITTLTETTLISLSHAWNLLAPEGALSITCYPGHLEGEKEEREILKQLSAIPSHEGLLIHHRFFNRPRSPSLIWALKNPT